MANDVHRENIAALPPRYQWWGRALNGENPDKHISKPQCGYYRLMLTDPETKAKYPVPVHVAPEDEDRVEAEVGFDHDLETYDHEKFLQHWPWCADNPISQELHEQVVTSGEWPDIDPVVWRQITAPPRPPDDTATKAEILKAQIEALITAAAAYTKIETDQQYDRAQTLRSRLLELERIADKERETEKAPHWEACQKVEQKYEFRKGAKKAADEILRPRQEAYARQRAAREAAEREARETAEAARRAAEQAARDEKAGEAGFPLEHNQPPVTVEPVVGGAPVLAPEPPPRRSVGGGVGRRASEKSVEEIVVDDFAALYAAVKNYPAVQELLTKIARDAFKSTGEIMPGCRTRPTIKLT